MDDIELRPSKAARMSYFLKMSKAQKELHTDETV